MSDQRCRSCDAPVKWIKDRAGKWQICEAKPKLGYDADGTMRTIYESHYAHCPDAEKWRKKSP